MLFATVLFYMYTYMDFAWELALGHNENCTTYYFYLII